MWIISESTEKILRLKEMGKYGLNIPDFYYLKKSATDSEFEEFLDWATKRKKEDIDTIFNIRTYNFERKTEQLQCPHITNIKPMTVLIETTWNLNKDYFCMIDTEVPENGRIAGNINLYIKNQEVFCNIDFCQKETRAMVRDADTSFYKKIGKFNPTSGIIEEKENLFLSETKLEHILQKVFTIAEDFIINKKMFSLRAPSVIMEWTYFSKETGIKKENLVWWEYRLIKE